MFKEIAYFLARVHTSGAHLAGILYLHRITDNRVTGSAARSFNLTRKMCGTQAARFATLVTTMWDRVPREGSLYDKAVERDNELARTDGYWGSMLGMGSRAHRWMGTRTSGLSILSGLLWQYDSQGPAFLKLQQELVNEKRDIDETEAGKELAKYHGVRWQGFQREITELRASIERELNNRRSQAVALLRTQKKDLESKLKNAEGAEQDLREGLDTLFKTQAMQYQALFYKTQSEAQEVAREVREMRADLDILRKQLRDDAAAFEDEVKRYRSARAAATETAQKRRLEEAHEARASQYQGRTKETLEIERLTETEIRKKERRKRLKRNALAILGMLGGVATIAAGGATMQIPVVAAGIALFGTAGMKLDFSKKKRKDEDKVWEVQEYDD